LKQHHQETQSKRVYHR